MAWGGGRGGWGVACGQTCNHVCDGPMTSDQLLARAHLNASPLAATGSSGLAGESNLRGTKELPLAFVSCVVTPSSITYAFLISCSKRLFPSSTHFLALSKPWRIRSYPSALRCLPRSSPFLTTSVMSSTQSDTLSR